MADTDKAKSKLVQDAVQILGREIMPPEIVDAEAWEEYIKLRDHPMLNERKMVTFSDGRKMSLGSATFRIVKIIETLPEAEQKHIMTLRKIYIKLLCNCNARQRRAYGTIVDKKGRIKVTGSKFILIKNELIELFGRMFSNREVHQLVLTQFNIPCTIDAIKTFRDQNSIEIAAKIEEHKRTYIDIRLGYKRSRLEELVWIYGTRKKVYELTKKGDDHRLLLMTLEQIRKEIEGDQLRIDGTVNINVEGTVNQHINQELFVNFPLKEIIIARVAARLKIGSEKLLTEIEKGYYNTYIQAAPNTVPMPAYPSMQTYDFDTIKRVQAQVEQKKLTDKAEVTVMPKATEDKAMTVKEMLLQKLKHKAEAVNYNKNKLAGEMIDKANV